jgi:hypothetical protein
VETVGKGTFQFDQKTADSTNIRSRQGFLETNVALFMRMCIELGALLLFRPAPTASRRAFLFPGNNLRGTDSSSHWSFKRPLDAKLSTFLRRGHIVSLPPLRDDLNKPLKANAPPKF